LRLSGNTFWLEKQDWVKFADYEAVVNSVIGKYKMLAICTYCLDKCGASEILDVGHNHQFALIKWRGDWKILESSSKNQLEARLAEQTAIAKALERSKKDWVKTFNAMSDWVALIDLKGRILRTNRAGENLTGKTLDEIIGQSCCKLVHGEDKPLPGCPLRTMLHSRQRATAELNVPNTNRWLMVTVDPVVNGKGSLVGAVHITRDITQRKKDEKALRESEFKYRSLFENMLNGFAHCKILLDYNEQPVDFVYLGVNDAFEKLTGLKKEKVLGKKVTEAIPGIKELHPELFDIYGKVALTGKEDRFDIHFKPLDIWLSIFVYSPQKGYFVTVFENITERKRAVEALRSSRDYLERLTNSMWDAVFSVKMPDRLIEWVNDSFRLTGYELEDCIGRTTEFLYPDKKEFIDFGNKLKEAIKAGEDVLHVEQLLKRKNGETFPAEITTTLFREKGEITRVTSIVRDITKRKMSEEKLLEYQEQLRSMASELSLVEERERKLIAEGLHDEISQPLAFLNIKLDLLKKSAKERSFIDSFSEMQTTIGKLISSARTFAFDLSSPVVYELGLEAGIEDWLHTNIQAKHEIATTFEDDGQIKPLDDDMRGFLFKAVRELLINVVKHAKASSVKVSVVRDEDKIKICVEDNGVGFNPAEKKGRLFDPSGYGLFSIHERLDYLRGSVDIESKLGLGTRVTLVAPLKIQGTEVKRGLQ